jgi:N4-gp56 family major capsid protein
MADTRYTDAGISQRTNVYAEREMLKHAMPELVLEKLALAKMMPKNKTQTVKFRRPIPFTAADTPLVEGVTPSATQFQYEDVSTSLRQYGQIVRITDHIEDTHEDPVLNDATMICGENIGRTIEKLNYGVVKAGTSVFYANGTARTDVNTAISLNKQRAVTRYLKSMKSKKITRILAPSTNYATRAVEAAYVAVGHTDLEPDIRAMAGFLPVAEYGQRSPISEHEIGSVEDVRYILSADLDPWENGGGAKGSMISAAGTSADVYPVLFFGQDSWATVGLRGQGAISPTIIPVNQRTKDDPLGQRGIVGWKTWHAALILNQTWMARLEVAATDL